MPGLRGQSRALLCWADPARKGDRQRFVSPLWFQKTEEAHGKAEYQRSAERCIGGGRHAASLGHSGACRPDRHEIWVRHRPVRRVLGARQRRSAALLPDSRRRRQGNRHDRHHRGTVGRRLAPGTKSLGRGRRSPVWLLPVRADHGRRGAAQEKPQADRQGHRSSDDQYLPVRHLPAHPRGRAYGGGCRYHRPLGRLAMNNMVLDKSTALSRRSFIVGSAAVAGGGLALGFSVPFGLDEAQAQGAAATEVNIWVAIKPDDTCVIRIARSEMGQGTLTGLAQLVAEELECDWNKVTTEGITPGRNLASKRAWGDMGT